MKSCPIPCHLYNCTEFVCCCSMTTNKFGIKTIIGASESAFSTGANSCKDHDDANAEDETGPGTSTGTHSCFASVCHTVATDTLPVR